MTEKYPTIKDERDHIFNDPMPEIKITPELLSNLKELASKATGDDWVWEDNPPTVYSQRNCFQHGLNLFGRLELDWNGKNNLNFITNCNPRMALALLAELDRVYGLLEDQQK